MSRNFLSFSLQKNVFVVGLIDLISEISGASFTIVLLTSVIQKSKKNRESISDGSAADEASRYGLFVADAIAIGMLSIHAALYLTQIFLCVLLLLGTVQESARKCRIWLSITAALLLVTTISVIINYIFGSNGAKPLSSIAPTFFLLVFKVYMLWIVHAFFCQVRLNDSHRKYDDEPDDVTTTFR